VAFCSAPGGPPGGRSLTPQAQQRCTTCPLEDPGMPHLGLPRLLLWSHAALSRGTRVLLLLLLQVVCRELGFTSCSYWRHAVSQVECAGSEPTFLSCPALYWPSGRTAPAAVATCWGEGLPACQQRRAPAAAPAAGGPQP
jgi:hypothetical protein